MIQQGGGDHMGSCVKKEDLSELFLLINYGRDFGKDGANVLVQILFHQN